jgi:hypothetical protein
LEWLEHIKSFIRRVLGAIQKNVRINAFLVSDSPELMPNRLRTFRGQIAATGLFCACQRHGGRSYAQKEQKATLPQDRSQAPSLDHAKSAVLNSLSLPHSRRNYKFAMEQSLHMIFDEPAQNSAMAMVENWNRFSFFSATFPS